MTHFEKLLCRNILFIYCRNCVTSDDQESMTDTVSECMTKKLVLLLKLHDQVLFLAPLKHTLIFNSIFQIKNELYVSKQKIAEICILSFLNLQNYVTSLDKNLALNSGFQ